MTGETKVQEQRFNTENKASRLWLWPQRCKATERTDGLAENGIEPPGNQKSHGEVDGALGLQEPHGLCKHLAVVDRGCRAREEATVLVAPEPKGPGGAAARPAWLGAAGKARPQDAAIPRAGTQRGASDSPQGPQEGDGKQQGWGEPGGTAPAL